MSFDLRISRPLHRPVVAEEQFEPRRKIRSGQSEPATRNLHRGVTTSNLHQNDSDADALYVGLDPEVSLAARFLESEVANPLETQTLAPPVPHDVPASVAVPAVQHAAENLADKKAQILAHAQQNQWNQVLALCVDALVTSPQDFELIETKGFAHIGLGQWTEALQCGNQILSSQSENETGRWLQSTGLKKRAEGYFSEQRLEEACADYEALMGISPDAEILKKLATCHAILQRWERALHCYKNLIDRSGEQDITVWRQIGYCCLKRRQEQTPFMTGEAEFALEACKKIIAVPEYSLDVEVWRLGYFASRHLQQVNSVPLS
ncbi:MAG: tetratricopeptide repeat protein [Parachlamydia sp.]|nr:tetratricopeptide repeat protein [Parachlamydia sp.]